ncbi:MAG TPA: hypothetical protein VGL53_01090, partial [Bryobacteraceae bacterium]
MTDSPRKWIWIPALLLVLIGLLAVARRTFVLVDPPQGPPRFAAAAELDAGFARHRTLTLLHILPAALFLGLMPLQFVTRVRVRWIRWHRWSGRVLLVLG